MQLRKLTAVVAVAFVALLIATSASADPTGSKNSLTVQANCSNGLTAMVVVNSANGQGAGAQAQNTAPFAPAHVLGSNAIFHPAVFDLTFTFTPAGGEPESFVNTNARLNPKTPVSCGITYSQTDPDGNTFALDGTVWGYFS